MPPRALHVAQARRNLDVVDRLLASDTEGSRQWVVVAAFYCALHCVEAHFADRGQHNFRHDLRRDAMALAEARISAGVYAAYTLLENRARRARYEMVLFSQVEVERMVRDYLRPIRRFAGID